MQGHRLGFFVRALPAFAILTLALPLSTVGCSDDDNADDGGGGPRFDPAAVSIIEGDTVKWVGVSGTHTVTSGSGSSDPNVGDLFDADLAVGGSFSHEFTAPGVFSYFCRPHEADGMEGTVTVSALTSKRVNVTTVGNTFSPDSVRINVGDTVRWTSNGSHTVTSGPGPGPTSGNLFDVPLPVGQTFSRSFNVAGTFNYYCIPHFSAGMTGKVVVVAPTAKKVEVEALD